MEDDGMEITENVLFKSESNGNKLQMYTIILNIDSIIKKKMK